MDDLRDRVRRQLERIEPSPLAFEDTMRLVRRRQRNRRVGAGAVGLLLTAALASGLWATLGAERGRPAGSPTPNPTPVPPGGDRLFLAGDSEGWMVDVSSGEARRFDMPELSPGDAPFRVVRRDGELVAWGYRTYVLDPDDPTSASVLANDSWIFIPSANPDRVWVGIVDPAPGAGRRLLAVREIAVDGRVTVPDVEPPGGRWPVAALNEGLVFREGDELVVWDWRTGRVVERLPGNVALAWQGDRLAWCAGDCTVVHVRDLATGDVFAVSCPPGTYGFEQGTGVFSPDGSRIALPLRLDRGSEARHELALIDVGSGTMAVHPSTEVGPRWRTFVDWSPSGASVFITGGWEEPRLIEYRPADGTTRVIPAQVGPFFGMAAI